MENRRIGGDSQGALRLRYLRAAQEGPKPGSVSAYGRWSWRLPRCRAVYGDAVGVTQFKASTSPPARFAAGHLGPGVQGGGGSNSGAFLLWGHHGGKFLRRRLAWLWFQGIPLCCQQFTSFIIIHSKYSMQLTIAPCQLITLTPCLYEEVAELLRQRIFRRELAGVLDRRTQDCRGVRHQPHPCARP